MHQHEEWQLEETDRGDTYCKACGEWVLRKHVTTLGCTLRTSMPPPNLDQDGKMLVLSVDDGRTAEVYLDRASIEFLREAL